jgi:IS5 family transposase
MLRTVGEQPTLWESILPAPLLGMPAELEAVDRLLDDARFFDPYRRFFHPVLGRPSIPIECYLRLMFLKYRYRLGFEPLCREVSDSITWQRFCRIPLGGRVPHPTTLMKITTRCGEQAVQALNDALLAKAVEAKVLKLNRVRADTTVVEANVAYPTDSGLLTKGIATMGRLAARLRAGGLAVRTRFRDDPVRLAAGAGPSTPTCVAAATTRPTTSGGSTPSWYASLEPPPAKLTPWPATPGVPCAARVNSPVDGTEPRWTVWRRWLAGS